MLNRGAPLRIAALAAVTAAFAGCSVSALAERESAIAENECTTDSECAGGACSGGQCLARLGELSTLLFELTPTSVGADVIDTPFLQFSGIPARSGEVELDLDLVPVVGSIHPAGREACAPVFLGSNMDQLLPALDHTIPSRVTFTPSLRALGLVLPGRASVAAPVMSAKGARAESYDFALSLPAGPYDILVEPYPLLPREGTDSGCAYPPQLIRGLCITGSADLELPLPKARTLALTVIDREQSFSGWVADIIDRATSRLISTRAPLTLPSDSGGVSEYSVSIEYLPVLEYDCEKRSAVGVELVRLSPPEGVIAPTVLFERIGLELFAPGKGRIEKLPVLSKPVVVEGHVFAGAERAGTATTLTFVARSLLGAPDGTITVFSRKVASTEEGRFEVELLPGTYDVQASPKESRIRDGQLRATTLATWEVAPEPVRQAGRAIELLSPIVVRGSAIIPSGSRAGARGSDVVADGLPLHLEDDVLRLAYDGIPSVPRATNGVITNERGNFTLFADPGSYGLSVRPPEGSGFAWLVLPRMELEADAAERQLARLELPLPIALSIHTSIDGSARPQQLAGARVRAFAPLDENGLPSSEQDAHSVVPIAEGRLDGNASVRLMVPASLKPTDSID